MHSWVKTLHKLALASRTWPTWIRYSISTLIVVALLAIRMALGDVLGRYPLLLFFPGIIACGLLFNRGNGIYATLLSALLASYHLLSPSHSLSVALLEDRLGLVLFVSTGLIMAVMVEALHVGMVQLSAEHAQLMASARDRQVLLDELAHRTRNDFANVIQLLRLQARSASEHVRPALLAAADRVQTVARVHRTLDLKGDRVFVDSRSYIEDLCAGLRGSVLDLRPIAIQCRAESHAVSIEKAVPLGLIVNECVTNAVKHAFPEDRQGQIEVTFELIGPDYRLTVEDNGVGISAPPRDGSLGHRLMQMLTAQLGGRIDIKPEKPGTAVVVHIPKLSEGRDRLEKI